MTFIVINEPFTCKNCGEQNPPLKGSCRNHCLNCLFSLHVDEKSPGDRLSTCQNLMAPVQINQSGKKGLIIYHKCQKCAKIIPNKVAPDDNFELIIKLSAHQNEPTRTKKTRK